MLCRLSYVRAEEKEPPAGVEPTPRPYKGRVLAVDTTEARDGDGRSRTDIFLVASEALVRLSYIPRRKTIDADGWSRTTTAEATGLQPAELARAQRPRTTKGGRPDSNRRRGDHDPGCFRLHHGHHEAGTTGLEPAASRLTSECSPHLSYAPEDSAGGIRTHGLELMRLARTASPLPRRSGRQESNLRSPAPEAGGVAYSPTARRSCKAPPAGLEPAASGLRARRHRPFDHGGMRSSGGRARTCALAINSRASYRLDHAGTRAEAAGLEPANGSRRLRGSNALPCQLGHVSSSGRRGSRTPKARKAHPFSRRDTAPVAVLPSSGPGRRRTCTVPGKSRELCHVELRSRDVTGRDRTCDAPRFRRALYRAELRSREMGGAGVEPATSSVSERRSHHLSYPPSSEQVGEAGIEPAASCV